MWFLWLYAWIVLAGNYLDICLKLLIVSVFSDDRAGLITGVI